MKAMKQLSLAETGFLPKAGKQTRKAVFLSEMETVVPWSRLEALIARVRQINPQVIDYMQFTHAKLALQRVGGGRRQAYRLEEFLLLRCHGR